MKTKVLSIFLLLSFLALPICATPKWKSDFASWKSQGPPKADRYKGNENAKNINSLFGSADVDECIALEAELIADIVVLQAEESPYISAATSNLIRLKGFRAILKAKNKNREAAEEEWAKAVLVAEEYKQTDTLNRYRTYFYFNSWKAGLYTQEERLAQYEEQRVLSLSSDQIRVMLEPQLMPKHLTDKNVRYHAAVSIAQAIPSRAEILYPLTVKVMSEGHAKKVLSDIEYLTGLKDIYQASVVVLDELVAIEEPTPAQLARMDKLQTAMEHIKFLGNEVAAAASWTE